MTPPFGTMTLQEAAKALFCKGIPTGPTLLFTQLRAKGVLLANGLPYQDYLRRGWFRVVRSTYEHPTRGRLPYLRVFVTERGMDELESLMAAPTVRNSRMVRPAIKQELKAEVKQQWQPHVELEWPVCVLGM